MKGYKDGQNHLLKLEVGEEIVSSIIQYCRDCSIESAFISGIGGVKDVELGYFDLPEKSYRRYKLSAIYELVSLSGNIVTVEGKPFLHAHAIIADADYSLTGGHLFSAVVAVTGEINIIETKFPVTRKIDDLTGLKLISPV